MASQGKLSAVSLRTSVRIQDGLVPRGVGGRLYQEDEVGRVGQARPVFKAFRLRF